MSEKTCPQCNQKFICGIVNGESTCWCFDLPNIIPLDAIDNAPSDCLCPQCLQNKIDTLSQTITKADNDTAEAS